MNRNLCDFSLSELKAWLQEQGEPEFRAQQIFDWVYKKSVGDWEQMSNLSKTLRRQLSEKISLFTLSLVRELPSADGETFKFLWRLADGNLVESVLICSGTRRTVCVSSQVGCPAKCAFCASGKQGLVRDLTSAEIVEQVIQINHRLAQKEERVTHVVYMGMGEPMRNYEAVVASIRSLINPAMLDLSQRRITVSTVGVIEGIQQLTASGLKVNLVLSLHAPNQQLRKKIIPYARQYPLDDIMEAMDRYSAETGRDVTYEYTLLAGINDAEEHAEELVRLLKSRQCTVNLIPYNPVSGLKLQRPKTKEIQKFQEILERERLPNTCRYTKGDDIAAACGQLALQKVIGCEE